MRKAEWPEQFPPNWVDDPLLHLTEEYRNAPIADGACFMLTKANVEYLRRIVKQGVGDTAKGALVLDLTFKVTACGFGLAGLAIPCKHLARGWGVTAILRREMMHAKQLRTVTW